MALFVREAVALARGPARRSALLAAVVAGMLCAFVYYLAELATPRLAANGLKFLSAGPASQGAAVRSGIEVLRVAAVWLAALLAPAAFAGMFSADRARGRLDLLLTTHVSRFEIVCGKYCSRFLWGVGLLSIPLPVMIGIGQIAGEGPAEHLEHLAFAVLTLAVAGAVGMLCGAWCRTPIAAALLSYLLLALAWVFVPLATIMLAFAVFRGGGPPYWELPWTIGDTLNYSPPAAILGLLAPGNTALGMAARGYSIWESAERLVPIAAVLLLATPWGLRPGEPARRRRRGWRWSPARWAGAWPVRDPLWLRARQAPVHDRSHSLRWTNVLVFGCVLLAWQARYPHEWLWLLPAVAVAIVGLAVAFATAADKQNGFFEQALLTALTPREIHRGYQLALAEHLRVPLLAAAGTAALACFMSPGQGWRPRQSVPIVALGFVEWLLLWRVLLAVAVALGLWARSATEAWAFFALALAVGGIVGIAVPLFIASPYWSIRADAETNVFLLRALVGALVAVAFAVRWLRGAWPAILATLLSPVLVFGPFAILPTEWQHWRGVGNGWFWAQAAARWQSELSFSNETYRTAHHFWPAWAAHAACLALLAWLTRRTFAVNFDAAFRPRDARDARRPRGVE